MLCFPGRDRPASGLRRLLTVACLALPLTALPASPAPAAKLVGGREEAAVARAFAPTAARRHQLIVSIRASTVAPSWVVVKSITPGRRPRLTSTYFQVSGGSPRRGTPPQAAQADLA